MAAPSARLLTAALIGVTAVWGGTFPLVKVAVEEHVGVFSFNGVRFLLAAAALALFTGRRMRTLGREGWLHGSFLGAALFAGYAFQTVGLKYTTSTNAGFVTGMFVVFTPLLAAALLRRSPGGPALVGALLAFVGMALLSGAGSFQPALGDVIILGCALSFAFHIVGLGAWAARHDAMALTVVQLLVVAVAHTVIAAPLERFAGSWDTYVAVALLITALLASAAAFWVQTAAQKVIPPTRTAVILTMEPVFAGVFGFVFLSERFGVWGWIGALLILTGMLIAELLGSAPPPAPPEDQTASIARDAAALR